MNKVDSEYESSLVILVPEAEPVVRAFREKFDPSASKGMPAHITINFPFQVDISSLPDRFEKLETLFSKYPPIQFALALINQFPGVLYLEPLPVSPLIEIIQAVAEEFPESPPYNGEFGEIIPHLTVAQVEEARIFNQVYSDFCVYSRGLIPVTVTTENLCLMDNKDGNWKVRKKFWLQG